jgi:hypothetical protein
MARGRESGQQGAQIPKVVMGIDDRKIGFEYSFGHNFISRNHFGTLSG